MQEKSKCLTMLGEIISCRKEGHEKSVFYYCYISIGSIGRGHQIRSLPESRTSLQAPEEVHEDISVHREKWLNEDVAMESTCQELTAPETWGKKKEMDLLLQFIKKCYGK